jgi:16S rRNA (cytidine1402-2'-O)-methyltransferase
LASIASDSRPGQAEGSGLPPGLWLVAVPIGAARDITLRALDALKSADVLAAEDTRSLRRLMEIHAIPLAGRPLLAYHDHSDAAARERLLAHLRAGRALAYAAEAGTPLIADPGYRLVQAALAEGIPVSALPGPSAALVALSLSGLPSDRFLFAGFAPSKATERRRWLGELAPVPATLVIYESPRRIRELLADSVTCLGDRKAALCRELTKRFEEVRRGTLSGLLASVEADEPRGEIVLVVDRGQAVVAAAGEMEAELRRALGEMSVRDASEAVARALGLPRREVYQAALRLAGKDH